MSKVRASEEVQNQINQLMAEADALNQKAQDADLSAEESAKLGQLVQDLQGLTAELGTAQASEEVARIKARLAEPTKPAPAPTQYIRTSSKSEEKFSHADALKTWLLSHTSAADLSHNAYTRTAKYGYTLGSTSIKMRLNYDRLNFKKRTILSTTGVGTGKEYIPQTYSDKVIDALTYASPFVGVLNSETTSDGNRRTYFKFDDTDLMSTYTSASGGSEINPTIPDVNITTASQDIDTFTITSGYHKMTFEVLQDSAVDLESRVAQAVANAHSRRIENDVINGTGDGNTGVQGLLSVDNSIGSVSGDDLGIGAFESLYWAMPQPYRDNMVFLYSDATAARVQGSLKDTTGRSLFDKSIVDDVEWPTILGKRCYVSQYMADDVILAFDPDMYMLRMVSENEYAVLREKFFPHVAFCGLMRFGGAWLGATGASGQVHSITIGS